MTRSQRLLALIQLLREYRHPVSAHVLAERLGVSIRTIYRDIETLVTQGANIVGEAGIGFVLKPGFLLPPMMWDANELEALILGTRWISHIPDESLQQAATSILAKLKAILPDQQQYLFEHTTLYANQNWLPVNQGFVERIRVATREQKKLRLDYLDDQQRPSQRLIWPISVGYFQDKMLLAAWCELRQDFRHFRLDRVRGCEVLEDRYPSYKQHLFRQWWDTQIKYAADKI